MHDLTNLGMKEMLDRLGSDAPTPGGGAASAVAGALGASLVAMLARLTMEHPEHAERRKLMEAIADQAQETRDQLLAYAAKDAEAYDRVVAAYGLPKETEEERKTREDTIQVDLQGATEIPLRIMEECLQVIGLAKNVIESGHQSAAADGAAGAVLARAGLQASSLIVKSNLAHLRDADYAQMTRTKMDEMLYMGTKVCTALDSYVNDLWK